MRSTGALRRLSLSLVVRPLHVVSNQTQSSYGWLLWLGIAAVAVAVAALGVFFMLRPPATPVRVTVVMGSNGTARLGGVPLVTTNLRDGAFAAMGALGLKASLTVPPLTNGDPQGSNVLETLKSMSRAGLFMTNQPPNPYE